jgi:hypothetical protein
MSVWILQWKWVWGISTSLDKFRQDEIKGKGLKNFGRDRSNITHTYFGWSVDVWIANLTDWNYYFCISPPTSENVGTRAVFLREFQNINVFHRLYV